MSVEIVLLLALWTACEAYGQVLFKRGMDSIEAGETHFGAGTLGRALRSPLIWGGIAVHVIEFAIWIEILGRLPLSIAFPLESISYVTVLVASRLLLREHIPARHWAGIGLICAGIVVLGAGA